MPFFLNEVRRDAGVQVAQALPSPAPTPRTDGYGAIFKIVDFLSFLKTSQAVNELQTSGLHEQTDLVKL